MPLAKNYLKVYKGAPVWANPGDFWFFQESGAVALKRVERTHAAISTPIGENIRQEPDGQWRVYIYALPKEKEPLYDTLEDAMVAVLKGRGKDAWTLLAHLGEEQAD